MGTITLPNPVRQLSVPPLAGLEGQGRGSVGGGGPPGGASHTFPPASSSVCGTHPHAFVCPYFHQRGCTRGGHPGFDCQGCCGACSSSISWLLQPPVCGLEDLGVVASCHRPISPQSLRGRVALPHGDPPVCSSVCPTGRLDGLHRPSGGVSPSSCSSGISSLPTLCGSWPRLPVHSAVLRSIHSPTGLHSGYGSCVSYTSFLGYPYASLPGRLARPGLLPGGSPPGSRDCLVPLSQVGDRSQPGEVQLLSVSGGPVSRGDHRRKDFYGVSRLRSTAGEFLCSAAPPASLWQSLLGMLSSLSHLVPGGHLRMRSLQICLHRSWDRLDPFLCRGLRTVLGTFGGGFTGIASLAGCPPSGFPGSGLLVRRFRRRLGGSLGGQGCFRPLGPVGGSSSSQCQGVAGSASWSPPLLVLSVRDHGGSVLRPRHRGCLSAQGGGNPVYCSQHHCAGDPPLGGISSDTAGSPVHSGDPQCSRRLSLLISSPAASGLSTWTYFDL